MIGHLGSTTRVSPAMRGYLTVVQQAQQRQAALRRSIDKMPTRRVTWVDLDGTKGSGTGRVLPNGTTVVGTREQVLAYLRN